MVLFFDLYLVIHKEFHYKNSSLPIFSGQNLEGVFDCHRRCNKLQKQTHHKITRRSLNTPRKRILTLCPLWFSGVFVF